MAFGAGYRKSGTYGSGGTSKIFNQTGMSNEDFNAQNGLTQDSSKKDFRNALRNSKATNINPNDTDFTSDLPGVGNGVATQGLRDAGNGLLGAAGDSLSAGFGTTGAGVGILGDILGQTQGNLNRRNAFEDDSRAATRGFQQGAIDPTLSAGTQKYVDTGLADRLAANDANFGAGGAEREKLSKNLANGIADIDALGVSGTGEASVIGNLLGNFQNSKVAADTAARETSRGELTAERNRVSDFNRQFATGEQAAGLQQGALTNDLLGVGKDIGTNTGTLGINQQAIGTDLAKTGVSALDAGLNRDIQNRGQEAEIGQGQKAFDINAFQQFLDNIYRNQQGKRNNSIEDSLLGQYLGDTTYA